MITFKDHTEALSYFAFVFEERGLFVTPAALEPLAVQSLAEHAGGVALNCSLNELFERAATLVPAFGTRADCPHAWCAGERQFHASLDSNEWNHESAESDDLAPGGMLFGALAQVGTAPPFYRLDIEPGNRGTVLGISEVLALADDFERHAVMLRAKAALLAELGGLK